MLHALLLSLALMTAAPDTTPEPPASEQFIVLSEFQIWADPAGPETYLCAE